VVKEWAYRLMWGCGDVEIGRICERKGKGMNCRFFGKGADWPMSKASFGAQWIGECVSEWKMLGDGCRGTL